MLRARSGSRGSDEDEEHICNQGQEQEARDQEEISLRVSPLLVLGFVVCMCGMLVLLYFFFDKLGKTSSIKRKET